MSKLDQVRVVEVLDEQNVVLNAGMRAGVIKGMRFVVFGNDKEITDLDGNSLGTLEIVKGYGTVSHVQDAMSILKSDRDGTGFKAQPDSVIGGLIVGTTLGTGIFLRVVRGDSSRPV